MDNIPPSCDNVIQAPSIWGLSIFHHMATESILGAFSIPSSYKGKEQEMSSVGDFYGLDLKVMHITSSHISFVNIVT